MAKAREMKIIKADETNFERIVAHTMNPEEFPLSEKLREQYQRWSEILVLRIGGWTPARIVKKWKNEKGIEQAQAYKDIRDSENLYGSMTKFSTQSRLALWTSWTEDYMLRMRLKGNDKMEGFAIKLLKPLETDDNAEFNPEKLENKEIHIVLSGSMEKMLQTLIGKGVVDFNSLNVTDIDFTDINDEQNKED